MKSFVKCLLAAIVLFAAQSSLFAQIGGSGSTHYISKFTGSTTIGNSILYDDGSSITLGNTIGADNPHAIYFGNEGDKTSYGIYRTPGSWSGSYQQLKIIFKTGIILDPGSYYGKSYVNIPEGGLRVTGGNVLIAKSSQVNSAYHLDVAGGIRCDSIVVNTNGADFVFDKDYQRMSLDTLGGYIERHKHLPGISSSTEMQREGVSLGSMQTKLLQKVEELTLYIIDQNKRIEKLEKENAEMRSRQ